MADPEAVEAYKPVFELRDGCIDGVDLERLNEGGDITKIVWQTH